MVRLYFPLRLDRLFGDDLLFMVDRFFMTTFITRLFYPLRPSTLYSAAMTMTG